MSPSQCSSGITRVRASVPEKWARIAMQTQLKPESVEGPKRVALLPARIAGLGGSLPQEGAGANAVPGLESPSPACRAALRFAEKS